MIVVIRQIQVVVAQRPGDGPDLGVAWALKKGRGGDLSGLWLGSSWQAGGRC